MKDKNNDHEVPLNIHTKFLFSTSGSQSSIEKYNKALKKLGVNMVYFSFPDAITPEIYAGLIRAPIARGAAVTGKDGLKSTIIPFLDEVEPLAMKTLVVNTVIHKNEKLYGYNTDSFGLKTALLKGFSESGLQIKSAVIYGYGGVSGAAYHVLKELGIPATLVGRNETKLLQKKTALGIAEKDHFDGPYDLVVDATPVSSDVNFLKAEGLSEILEHCKMVFCHNMPEKDHKTNYLKAYCDEKNLFYIPGKWMYEAQLVKQYSLFFEGFTKADGITPITEKDIAEIWGIK